MSCVVRPRVGSVSVFSLSARQCDWPPQKTQQAKQRKRGAYKKWPSTAQARLWKKKEETNKTAAARKKKQCDRDHRPRIGPAPKLRDRTGRSATRIDRGDSRWRRRSRLLPLPPGRCGLLGRVIGCRCGDAQAALARVSRTARFLCHGQRRSLGPPLGQRSRL